MTGPMRWRATVYYRSEVGLVDVQYDLSEIEDLHELVELGPHWDTVHEIRIKRVNATDPKMTVEQAERQ